MDTAVIEQPFARDPEPKRWTAEEYLRMAELGFFDESEPVELLDGEIVRKMSPIGVGHAVGVSLILEWLVRVKPAGMGLFSQSTTRMSIQNMPEPDIALLRKPVRSFERYPTASDVALAIEVADSSLRLDQTRKARIYGAAGVPEYWILNLRDRVLEVYREPKSDGYGSIERCAEDTFVRPLFADVEVLVSDLLPSATPKTPEA